MSQKFFITTPIYYSNDIPHIGHAYSTFIADTYARYKRLLGHEVKFSTWVDENSQKIVQKAEEAGIPIQEYLDSFASKHIAVRDALDISYTDFIRTTGREIVNKDGKTFQYNHKAFVQKILQQVYDKQDGDIYQGEYVWLYCVWCEAFKKPTDLVDATDKYVADGIPVGEKVCPDHPNKHLEQIKEKNRFFKLSKYENFLKDFYANNPQFVIPQHRFNEVISLVKSGLEDFSISREGKTFGIPLPFDTNSVTYVRYDALLNYVTVCLDDNVWTEQTEKIHVLGKDISRFHAVYRPAMLESAGLPKPNKEIVTGFFTVDGQKMSKTIGNVINPVEVVEKYGRDALVFYLLYDIPIGADGDYSTERFTNTYNSILLWWRGNLVSRVTNIAAKNEQIKTWLFDAAYLRKVQENNRANEDLIGSIQHLVEGMMPLYANNFSSTLDNANIQQYLQKWYGWVQAANFYMQNQQPRTKLKDEATKEDGIKDIQFLLYVIKNLALLSAPILTQGFARVQEILGNPLLQAIDTNKTLQPNQYKELLDLQEFDVNLTPGILYNRGE